MYCCQQWSKYSQTISNSHFNHNQCSQNYFYSTYFYLHMSFFLNSILCVLDMLVIRIKLTRDVKVFNPLPLPNLASQCLYLQYTLHCVKWLLPPPPHTHLESNMDLLWLKISRHLLHQAGYSYLCGQRCCMC